MLSLKKLVADAFPDWKGLSSLSDVPVKGIECDSRKVEKDFLFFAIPGAKLDGSAFVAEAVSKGASAVVAARNVSCPPNVQVLVMPEPRVALARIAAVFYGRPSVKMHTAGITGTNGKTTVSFLLEYLLQKQKKNVGAFGTVSTRFAGREIPAVETTPGPLKIQALLAEMAKSGVHYVVMEVSSHALDQHRVEGIDFRVAVFTNLTRDHLDYHKDFEHYFEAKSRLFTGLSKESTAVINVDDEWGKKLLKKTQARIVTYAIKEKAGFQAIDIEWRLDATHFFVVGSEKKIAVQTPLLGRHNVYNILAALAAAEALGLDLKKAAADLKDFRGVPGRLERIECKQDFLVFVDYAHTPDGLENVLKAVKPYTKKKLMVVFGCGGDRDKVKRPQMGRIAAYYCDRIFITSDNPRSEDPRTIATEIRRGVPADFKDCFVQLDRHKAIRQALLSARAGDIVLLAGKGHETTQVIGTQSLRFNDKEEAEKILSGR